MELVDRQPMVVFFYSNSYVRNIRGVDLDSTLRYDTEALIIVQSYPLFTQNASTCIFFSLTDLINSSLDRVPLLN